MFSAGSQPDVVLSMDRDSYYSTTLIADGASELLEGLIGSRRAEILGPEVRLVAMALYHGLTTLAGKQTLGQEYCDLLLIGERRKGGADPPFRPLSSVRRLLYVLLNVLLPYLSERAHRGWAGLSELGQTSAQAHHLRMRQAAAAAARSGNRGGDGGGDGGGGGRATPAAVAVAVTAASQDEAPAATAWAAARVAAAAPLPASTSAAGSAAVSAAAALLRRLTRPLLLALLGWLRRLHLAAFYLGGAYFTPAMRLAGVRLMHSRALDTGETRARYAVLGLFTAVPLVVEAASAAGAASASAAARAAEAAVAARVPSADDGEAEAAPVLRPCGISTTGTGEVAAVVAAATATASGRPRRRCALCMGPREYPAATPCGHLFCWRCIIAWCQTSPECPLCRQPADPQSIVCVYQYD
ncbi:unnamed protein product [Phaeothamnion confervicola]